MMRIFSYLFHGLLAAFMLVASTMTLSSGRYLQIDLFPWWQGDTLTYVLLGAAILGLVAVALALLRVLPVLFLAWSVLVFLALTYGFFFTSYYLGNGALSTAAFLTLGALLAIVGSWLQYRRTPSKI